MFIIHLALPRSSDFLFIIVKLEAAGAWRICLPDRKEYSLQFIVLPSIYMHVWISSPKSISEQKLNREEGGCLKINSSFRSVLKISFSLERHSPLKLLSLRRNKSQLYHFLLCCPLHANVSISDGEGPKLYKASSFRGLSFKALVFR